MDLVRSERRDRKEQREREALKVAALTAVNRLFYSGITPSEVVIDLAEVRAQIDAFRKTLKCMGLNSRIPKDPAVSLKQDK